MEKGKRDISIVRKILGYCDGITEFIRRFEIENETLKTDRDYQDSVAMKILQIGELSVHLSEEFRRSHSEMPWTGMKAMRNIAAHEYENFDFDYLWRTINEDIPQLRDFCQRILDQGADEQGR